MDTTPASDELPPSLRFLKALVIVLTMTMIVGVIVVVSMIVIRFPTIQSIPAMPDSITLPDGTVVEAFTQTRDWYAVITADNRILIFDRASGALLQTVILN